MAGIYLPTNFLHDLYTKILLTRIIDEQTQYLCQRGTIEPVPSCYGYEAIQVGSALCIEVGQDFTLPYYRDLGVVLTIGMTPYEVFRSYLQTQQRAVASQLNQQNSTMEEITQAKPHEQQAAQSLRHWGYQKHNTITGPVPVATQLLHAVGIAFACKLRKAAVATIAYCGAEVSDEADFAEAIRFAVQHQLAVVFICEHASTTASSCFQPGTLPSTLNYQRVDGTDILTIYTAMQQALQQARAGAGPTLLEMTTVTGSFPATTFDALYYCQQLLQRQEVWDSEWANQLKARLTTEVERAFQDALRDTPQPQMNKPATQDQA